MSNKKMIIKNCPNCLTYDRPKAICGLTYEIGGFKGETTSYKYCQDCTDCLLKRIVKLCKDTDYCENNQADFCNEMGFSCCEAEFKKQILQLFDIEEINR